MRGSWDANIRDKELDGDGVACEVIFPDADAAGVGGVSGTPFGAGLGSSGDSDPVLVMEGAKAHNRWLAELCSDSPERRVGVALVPILHDHDGGDRGDRVGRLPRAPRRDDPDPVDEPAVVQRSRSTTRSGQRASTTTWCCTRIPAPAPPTSASARPRCPIYASEAGWWAARPMHVLILGGVFERFPTLHYCVAENGACLGSRPARPDGREVDRRPQHAQVRHRGVPRRALDEARRLHRPQLLARRVHHAPDRGRPPLRHRDRQPHVGQRLPAPRGDVAAHARVAAHALPRRARRRDAQDPRAERGRLLRVRPRCARAARRSDRPDGRRHPRWRTRTEVETV